MPKNFISQVAVGVAAGLTVALILRAMRKPNRQTVGTEPAGMQV
ncbi:MAG: hypothetical protein AAF092_10570 [Pseudomonadota bacterium]